MWPDGEPSPGSEVVIIGDRSAAGAPALPLRQGAVISHLNAHRSDVHLGDNYVNITQNIHKPDVVKGNLLCLELVAPDKPGWMRCSVAVFTCWALAAAAALAFCLFYFVLPTPPTILDIGLNEPWYVRRRVWQARPAYSGVEFHRAPVPFALVAHAVTSFCSEPLACINIVRAIQVDHLEKFSDIGPNFLVGNGTVFEGRGANAVPAMLTGWNRDMVGVMFLGDYRAAKDVPDPVQFQQVQLLLDRLVTLNVLQRDYQLFGVCQVVTDVISPGINLVRALGHFSHWNNTKVDKCSTV